MDTASTNRISKSPGALRLLNIARIAPEKNLLFAVDVLKNVKGNIEFDFYGPIYDSNYWEKCKKEIKQMPSNVSANYKGVADEKNVFNILKQYHFLFLPSQGENFGHIILEALSAGTPAIISDNTPWKNLQEHNAGWDISLKDAQRFADVIHTCLEMDDSQYELYSRGAGQL